MPESIRRNTSKKRNSIYEALCATKSHPTAEMLHSSLKAQIPDLSLGTVYRSLALFVKEGKAISVGNVEGNERYDAVTCPHPHFICRSCGNVLDFPLPEGFDKLYDGFKGECGCRIEAWSLDFTGLCPLCAERESGEL